MLSQLRFDTADSPLRFTPGTRVQIKQYNGLFRVEPKYGGSDGTLMCVNDSDVFDENTKSDDKKWLVHLDTGRVTTYRESSLYHLNDSKDIWAAPSSDSDVENRVTTDTNANIITDEMMQLLADELSSEGDSSDATSDDLPVGAFQLRRTDTMDSDLSLSSSDSGCMASSESEQFADDEVPTDFSWDGFEEFMEPTSRREGYRQRSHETTSYTTYNNTYKRYNDILHHHK